MEILLPKILLVEDEKNLAFTLELNLKAEGYEVFHAADGLKGFELFCENRPFAGVILDIMLPGLDGHALAKKIREQDPRVGIMFLSALDSDADRIDGLKLGVDDYISKPFRLTELLIRLKRMVERGRLFSGESPSVQRNLGFELNAQELTLNIDGQKKPITDLEARILDEFLKHAGQVLSRKYLLEKVWKMPGNIETRTVDNFIVRLRKLIEKDPTNPKILKSIRGRGYQYCVPTDKENPVNES